MFGMWWAVSVTGYQVDERGQCWLNFNTSDDIKITGGYHVCLSCPTKTTFIQWDSDPTWPLKLCVVSGKKTPAPMDITRLLECQDSRSVSSTLSRASASHGLPSFHSASWWHFLPAIWCKNDAIHMPTTDHLLQLLSGPVLILKCSVWPVLVVVHTGQHGHFNWSSATFHQD